ncbi:MAG: amidohydrolase family protein [Sphingobacteriales bacterium]
MILNNLKTVLKGSQMNIRLADDHIAEVSSKPFAAKLGQFNLNFDGALVFPGLVNSHDHLDFNLFPALGDRTYKNYTEWGRYIHKNYGEKIARILRIPTELSEQWGVYKNLLNGVTTVVNHGKKIKKKALPITVYEDCQSIHSVRFEKKWWLALNNPLKRKLPVAIHTGEGTDIPARQEIDKLIQRNLLKRPLVGIHGVAMNNNQAKAFKALVWCPESNYFLLNNIAPVNCLKKDVSILFGTDSTLTGSWNLWEHIRRARDTDYLTDAELFDSLTSNPARIWELDGGEIAVNKCADLVIAENKADSPDSFFALNPEDILMVIHKGAISLFDERLYRQLKNIDLDNYSRVYIKGRCKYVSGDLPLLMQQIKQHYPEADFPVI